MADAAKRSRSQAKSNFTRATNVFNSLVDTSSSIELVKKQFDKVMSCWDKLEEVQETYIAVADIDVDTDKDGVAYLDDLAPTHSGVITKYSQFLKDSKTAEDAVLEKAAEDKKSAEEDRIKIEARERIAAEEKLRTDELNSRFESAKTEIVLLVEAFNTMHLNFNDSLKDSSDEVKREEWGKVESDFKSLQSKFVTFSAIDPSQDINETKTKYDKDAHVLFKSIQKWIGEQPKTASNTSGGSVSGSNSSTSSTSSISSKGTRQETVPLPTFKGDESGGNCSPFLQFPIWKKSWDALIVDYEERFHYILLAEHLDDAAKGKFVGSENDYATAMKKLMNYYGDVSRVVKCVVKDVMSQPKISERQYSALVLYSDKLENNFNRLLSLQQGVEHEMSNSTAMSTIMLKFPLNIREKWEEFLIGQTSDVKLKPFREFIAWLSSQKEIWQRMASLESESCDSGDCNQFGFYGDVGNERSCFKCGQKGHMKRECPKRENKDRNNRERKPRDNTKIKKFWCALHKDDASRFCESVSCRELRHLEPTERIKLLKENKDCKHCCGDHKYEDCPNNNRVCGGGKDNRGCTKNHKVHEMFCVEAKVFALQCVLSANTTSDNVSNIVVLLIMKVQMLQKGKSTSVFWDTGCTSNFIRDDFAKECGFRGEEVTLNVTTLGGVVTDYKTVISYKCSILDTEGYIHYFNAYGMNTITGDVSKISFRKLKQLFPHTSDESLHTLERDSGVNILIGLGEASWQPERDQKAKGGGDFWIYRNMFGSCVGGRHPNICEETSRNQELFFVNHMYHAMVSPKVEPIPHELEFCAERVKRVALNDTLKKSVREATVGGYTLCVSSESVNSPTPKAISHEASTMSPLAAEFVPSGNVVPSPDSTKDISHLPVAIPVVAEKWIEHQTSHCVLCNVAITSPFGSEELFFKADSLGTIVQPLCGGCKCSRCPVPGSKYSYKEQQEFDIINKLLFRKDGENRWYTSYPWKNGRDVLPKNDKIALKSLLSLEKMLKRHPEKATAFCEQIDDMVERGAAILLSDDEVNSWNGPYHYLPMVLVKGKRWRVCFDASRSQCGYPAFNKHLHKGPDRFVNNIASVIIGFRNGRVAAVADLSKFHNQIYLVKEDVHMQRFLWRRLLTDISPQIYAVPVNNFGVTSANCIATCALHKSADVFAEIYPKESAEIKVQTYIDDELVAAPCMEELRVKTARMDEICAHAGMENKGWTYSGDNSHTSFSIGDEAGIASDKVLGLLFSPSTDSFHFNVVLRFKIDGKEVDITSLDILLASNIVLTRRNLTSNIARIFDPIGFLCAILLMSKLLMREMWLEKGVGWDDPISNELSEKWMKFLSSLLSLENLEFKRSLWPDAEVDGLPMLIIFSDGSELAFGAVAYIRWKLKDGGFWSRLIMAKCKIAPKNRRTVPQLELEGARLGDRMKNFILKDTNLEFSKVYQFVDSSTVLGYVQKEYGVFKPYEGIRIAEIQSTNVFVDGKLKGWAWVAGSDNPADWCTKPRCVEDIISGGFWVNGSMFLSLEESCWPIRFSYKKDDLEGMRKIPKPVFCAFAHVLSTDYLARLVTRSSSWKKMVRLLTWMCRIAICDKTMNPLLPSELARSRLLLLKYAQESSTSDLTAAANEGKGPFRKLAPLVDDNGLWRVGSRMRHFVPFTFNHQLPVILPYQNRITLLIMTESHQFSHSGQDGTLSRFRSQGYWTVRGGQLARKVKTSCIPCRKANHETMRQPMGVLPDDRLNFPISWGSVQLDLLGPFSCRGDVNPRTTKKTWGMLIEDVNCGAVYIDVVSDYSAAAVIMTLVRFGELRGYPNIISSDPGSQLESASGIMEKWWKSMSHSLQEFGSSKGFEWKISPPDSPWRQGKAERRIGIVKKLLYHSVGDSRLTPLELQTVFFKISNICNERPLGLSKPRADGSYELITPNQLLLGTNGNVFPDDESLSGSLGVKARYRLVKHVTDSFWKRWCTHVSPALVLRQKWHEPSRNLCVGDLVMICEDSKIKSKYKMAVVESVKYSSDDVVRSATVRYCNIQHNPKGEDTVTIMRVNRSIQRLVLIMPVEEMDAPVVVKDYEHKVKCVTCL